MTEHGKAEEESRRRKAEILARFVGPTLRHDEEDIEFWRNASDELRGQTLYELLRMVNAIGHYPDSGERFPGFPKKR